MSRFGGQALVFYRLFADRRRRCPLVVSTRRPLVAQRPGGDFVDSAKGKKMSGCPNENRGRWGPGVVSKVLRDQRMIVTLMAV